MQTTWILSANAGRARIFSEDDPAEPLHEVEDMVNEAVRLRTSESETDRMGPTAAAGSGHNIGFGASVGGESPGANPHNGKAGAPNKQYQPNQTPAEHEAELFARDIAKYLLDAHRDGRYEKLVISASPQFLGELRTHLDAQIKPLIKLELNKDYTHFNAHQLREQLRAQMAKSH